MSSIEYRLEQMAYANTSRQMTWQEKMSNTSHQREVKDLIAAGLNPVLSSGGQGAQAYNTSVDSAVNAIGNIQASREAAAATRYAARQSAAATRAAAAAQLAATKYNADAQERMNTVTNQTNWNIHQDSNSGSFAGLLNRFLNRLGVYDLNQEHFMKQKSVGLGIYNRPEKYFNYQSGNISKNNFSLNSAGKEKVNSGLRQLGISVNSANRDLYTRAFVFHEQSSLLKLIGLVKAKQKADSNARRLNR